MIGWTAEEIGIKLYIVYECAIYLARLRAGSDRRYPAGMGVNPADN